jgi:sterol 14-demethylase
LKQYVPVIEKEARDFFNNSWPGKEGEVDLVYDLNKLTIITASRCLLGKELRSNPSVANEFVDLFHDLEGGLNPIAFFFPNIPIPQHIKRDKAREKVTQIFMKLIKQRRQVPEGEKPVDMLQTLMESQYKGGIPLDDQSICGLLIGLLFAGQHTSGITSSWTGFFLLKEKKYLQEVLQEQREIIKEHGKEITFETLKKSVKLENCVREALRMYPPLIILMRKVMKDITYKDYTIPAGDFLCVSPGFAMRLPEIYTNPNTYDPSRFDRGEDKSLPYAYIPFGGGRHGCPGENFGIMQIKTIWTVLLREFEFEFGAQGFPAPDYTNLVVGPHQPALLKYKRRAVPFDAM